MLAVIPSMNVSTYITRASAAQLAARASLTSSALAARAAQPTDPAASAHPLTALGRPERDDLGASLNATA